MSMRFIPLISISFSEIGISAPTAPFLLVLLLVHCNRFVTGMGPVSPLIPIPQRRGEPALSLPVPALSLPKGGRPLRLSSEGESRKPCKNVGASWIPASARE